MAFKGSDAPDHDDVKSFFIDLERSSQIKFLKIKKIIAFMKNYWQCQSCLLTASRILFISVIGYEHRSGNVTNFVISVFSYSVMSIRTTGLTSLYHRIMVKVLYTVYM